MRKQYKNKTKSVCGLCKSHKRGWSCRWKIKDKDFIERSEKEMKDY